MKGQKLISKLNQSVKSVIQAIGLTVLMVMFIAVPPSWAQNVDQVRWKSESQVRDLLGNPNSIHGPVGTHASYTLWKYDDFTVAFANNRAFHLFDKDSLKKLELNENRSYDDQ